MAGERDVADRIRRREESADFVGWDPAAHVLDPVHRRHLGELEEELKDLWNLGRNIVLMWCPGERGIDALFIPHYAIADFAATTVHDRGNDVPGRDFIGEILAGSKLVGAAKLRRVAELVKFAPSTINLSFAPGRDLGLDVIDRTIKRYSISFVGDRAVALFDIVGFSLYSPLEQVTQLNSLSYSVNAAHNKMLAKKIDISFARTTTGDGFYIWNRDRSIQANVNLYHFMHLVLADNAVARRKSKSNLTPLLRTSFHVGGHYEFYQSESLSPTIFSYIVGDVTIELARLIDKAQPGQVVVGDFQVPMADAELGRTRRVDTVQFIEKTQETLENLQGLELSGDGINAIKCYLTGGRRTDDRFTIKRYLITDKHGFTRHAYNAKINIYREHAEPIFLGVQDKDLHHFGTADEVVTTTD